jgi:hypothetical protein
MIEKIPVGSEALDYVIARLQAGHTLSQCLLGEWSEFRRAHALLPSGLAAEVVTDFASGGKLVGGAPDGDPSIVRIANTDAVLGYSIAAYLKVDPKNVCIFENAFAGRADPHVARLSRVFFFEQEVYHYLSYSDHSDDVITATLKAAKSIPQVIGVLTKCAGEVANPNHTSVSMSLLQSLAHNAQAIIAGAYDGESYVIVER